MILLTALAITSLASATPLSTYPHSPNSNDRPNLSMAPLLQSNHYHGSINDSYMVILKKEVHQSVRDNHFNYLQSTHFTSLQPSHEGVRHVYNKARGYAAHLSPEAVEALRMRDEVDYVEQDQIVKATEVQTQKGAPWGLARISHRGKLSFGTFTKYLFAEHGGEGVDVYVIDTGINVNHVEFEGRAFWGKTIPQNDQDIDGNGHGTHCAGTIASRAYGVAKGANVIAVKVLGTNGSGTMSDVVAGVEWAAESAKAKAASGVKGHKGSVANMSLGGGKSRVLDDAVDAAVEEGMHFAVAAGNENRDACNSSPAASKNAVTVGASDLADRRAEFSNWGKCVDIFGPGVSIKSTWNTGTDSTNTISGTSMASPHTAGVIAYLLSIYGTETFNPPVSKGFTFEAAAQRPLSLYAIARSALPSFISGYLPEAEYFAPIPSPSKGISTSDMKKALIALGTKGALSDLPKDTVNILLFNNATSV